MLRGRFIIQTYFKKQVQNQIKNLTLHLKQLGKEEVKSPRVSRRKETIKIRAEINAKETKEIMASGPITSWEIDGETVETVSDFLFLGAPKSLQMVTAAMKLKDVCS